MPTQTTFMPPICGSEARILSIVNHQDPIFFYPIPISILIKLSLLLPVLYICTSQLFLQVMMAV